MEMYNKLRTCPKCGSQKAKTKYVKNHFMGDICDFMERTCVVCGYSWNEHPLDYSEQKAWCSEHVRNARSDLD